MKTFVEGPKVSVSSKIFKIILNRLNHFIARKNILNYPQLVIFSFDHIGLSINMEGRYENSPLRLVEKFIHDKLPNAQDQVLLDIGANIGNHSVFFSSMFKKIYAFEPNPVTYEVLRINSEYASNNKNIEHFNFGLSDAEDTLPFYVNSSNIGGSAIVSKDYNSSDTISVSVKQLDDIREIKNEFISLIKIDVEGHELNVLRGAKKTLTKNMPAILFEQQASEIHDGSSEVINFLKELGYEFYVTKKNFYFGEAIISKIISLVLRSIFGERSDFVTVEKFQNVFYDMILAIPKSKWVNVLPAIISQIATCGSYCKNAYIANPSYKELAKEETTKLARLEAIAAKVVEDFVTHKFHIFFNSPETYAL